MGASQDSYFIRTELCQEIPRGIILLALKSICAYKQSNMETEQLKAEHAALMKVFTHAGEFCKDWRKGDFKLPRLAALDAASLEEQLIAASSVMCNGENYLS
jgi:hypothetical protein